MRKHLDHKRLLSLVSHLCAAMVVLGISATASAAEPEGSVTPSSAASREQVRQELVQAQRENRHLSRQHGSEADAFEPVRERSRKSVRAQAQLAVRGPLQRDLFSGG